MTPSEADSYAGAGAAYVHIPFCSAVCPYCDFAVVAGRDDRIEAYVDALCSEIAGVEPWRSLQAVYFGGGTPSRVPAHLLARVLEALDAKHGITTDAEISLEANPEDFTPAVARQLWSTGVNRLSFGAQSFDVGVLTSLGRGHGPSHISAAVGAALDQGFENLSLDLIFGTPGETDRSWKESLRRATGLEPAHVSCYSLTVERGTQLGRAVRDGAPGPDPDTQATRYEVADGHLGDRGYERYEVSNWARPGFECRYNLTVWAQGEYEAYGNGAHGFRNGKRFRNHRSLDAYLRAIQELGCARVGEETVEGWDAELDRIFVGLRRSVGVSRGPGTEALWSSPEGQRLEAAGVINAAGERLRVLRPLHTDAVQRSAIAQTPPIVGVRHDA